MRSKIIRTLLLAAVIGIGGVVGAQEATPAPLSCKDPTMDVYGDMWREQIDADRCYLDESVTASTSVSYPQRLANESPFAQSIMLDYISQQRFEFWESIQDFAVGPEQEYHSLAWSLMIQSDMARHSDTIVSVIFTNSTYGGGPREWVEFDTFTFDLASEQVLTLNDIFLEDVDPYTTLAPLARAALEKRVGPMEAIVSGTVPIPDNYTAWALTPTDIMFFYRRGQVAHGAYGSQIVSVPLADLADSLKPEFQAKPFP